MFRRNKPNRKSRIHLILEQLEDRCVPSAMGNEASDELSVIHTGDSGPGSLRAAMDYANVTANIDRDGDGALDPDPITFDLAADDANHLFYQDDGVAGQVTLANVSPTTQADDADIADIDPDWAHSWWSIASASPLPALTDPVMIDGYSQAGSSENTNAVGQGLNTVLRVELNGANSAEEGDLLSTGLLTLRGGDSTVRGLALNRAPGPKILIEGNTDNNRVEGNFIGSDISGTQAFAPSTLPEVTNFRGFDGVRLLSTSGNVIGGATAAARNLISGNNNDNAFGVHITGLVSIHNSVEGNLIGTDLAGTQALANSGGVNTGYDSMVGGADPGARNVISGNNFEGVRMQGRDSLVQNNLIGTDVTGTLALGNIGAGVVVPINSGDHRILENSIAFNLTGVAINSGDSVGNGNLVSGNLMFANVEGGFELAGAGENDIPPQSDPPDQDTGPNGLQNYPALLAITETDEGTEIQGKLQSTPNSDFRIEFFANSKRDSGYDGADQFSQGESFLGSIDISTKAAGVASFTANLAALPTGQPYVTVTATDITDDGSGPRNNTSELSPVAVLGGPKFTVTNTNDFGLGSLREAIINANLTTGRQTITFDITANDARHFYYRDDGVAGSVTFENITVTNEADDANIGDIDPDWVHSWFSVQPSRELPKITDPVSIDGYSQSGANANTIAITTPQLNTVLKIEVDGRKVSESGLILGGVGNSDILGLAINGFGGNGVVIDTLSGKNSIRGSFIGTDVSGTISRGNARNGILLMNETGTTVGGTDAAARVLISANGLDAIRLAQGSGANSFSGFILGGGAVGQRLLLNGGNAIAFEPDNGDSAIEFNTNWLTNGDDSNISAGKADGANNIRNGFTFSSFRQMVVMLLKLLPSNQKHGVFLSLGWLVGLSEGAQNSHASTLSSMSSGPITAIDLNADGVTPNDTGDLDDGPHGLQNYPVLASATTTESGTTTVTGTFNSLANTSFRIEIYASSYDTSRFRAGERSLGTVDVTTDANGNASFTFESPETVPVGYDVISLATRMDEEGSLIATSEFSAGIEVTETPSELTQNQLDGIVAAARQRWESTSLSAAQLAALERTSFLQADLPDGQIAVSTAGVVWIDSKFTGNSWFVDESPLEDSEFTNAVSPTQLSAANGSALAGRLDLLTVVMHQMGRVMNLDTARATELLGATPAFGTRSLPRGENLANTLAKLHAQHGFSQGKSYYENWLGLAEKWFRNRSNAWHYITPAGDIYRWISAAADQNIATVDPMAHADPTLLFHVPAQLTDSERTTLRETQLDHGFYKDKNYWENWSKLGEKWLRDRHGEWHYIANDGVITRSRDKSQVVQVTTLAFQTPELLFAAMDRLLAEASATAAQVQTAHGFRKGDSYWQNYLGQNEKWFQDRNNQWHYITAGGWVTRSKDGVQVAQLTPLFWGAPELLFSASETLLADLVSRMAIVQSAHGFHRAGSYSDNWLGRNEKWFKDRAGLWHFITPDGKIWQWSGNANVLVTQLTPAIHADPVRLFATWALGIL